MVTIDQRELEQKIEDCKELLRQNKKPRVKLTERQKAQRKVERLEKLKEKCQELWEEELRKARGDLDNNSQNSPPFSITDSIGSSQLNAPFSPNVNSQNPKLRYMANGATSQSGNNSQNSPPFSPNVNPQNPKLRYIMARNSKGSSPVGPPSISSQSSKGGIDSVDFDKENKEKAWLEHLLNVRDLSPEHQRQIFNGPPLSPSSQSSKGGASASRDVTEVRGKTFSPVAAAAAAAQRARMINSIERARMSNSTERDRMRNFALWEQQNAPPFWGDASYASAMTDPRFDRGDGAPFLPPFVVRPPPKANESLPDPRQLHDRAQRRPFERPFLFSQEEGGGTDGDQRSYASQPNPAARRSLRNVPVPLDEQITKAEATLRGLIGPMGRLVNNSIPGELEIGSSDSVSTMLTNPSLTRRKRKQK